MSEISGSPVPYSRQFTLRGIIIGAIGSAIITTSSIYVALTLGALPWPTIFVALVAMFSLRALGRSNLNEMNVCHTAMSAGAMIGGGLAFTIPGLWMLNPEAEISLGLLLIITIGGTLLGLIFTALIRKFFVETKALPYPMGQAAAETLTAGDAGGKKSRALFISMGGAGVFTFLRDWFGFIPSLLFSNVSIPGVAFGVWASPMMLSVGYIIGPLFIAVWFLGGLIGDFGIVVAGPALGLWDATIAANIKTSLGIGVMIGTGCGIIVKSILPRAKEIFSPLFSKEQQQGAILPMRWAPWLMLVLAAIFCFVLDLKPLASIAVILGAWITTSMSALIVGQSGINPMEIFGVIILIFARLVGESNMLQLFAVAAIIAVACGLTGDVMNDFKEGHLLRTNPKAQWVGELIGGLVGAVVAACVLLLLYRAYGPEAFGGSGRFPAPQAGVVAAMVGGIPHLLAFWIGIGLGLVLYCVNFPVMTLGLGIYLPFYLTLTVFLGGLLNWVVGKVWPLWQKRDTGLVIGSGLLGGEAVVGVIIALIQVWRGLAQL